MRVISLDSKGKKYKVTFSNDDSYLLNEELVLEYRLVKDKEIADDMLDEILAKENEYDLYLKTLNYLSKHDVSTFKIKKYLLTKGATNEEIENIIYKLNQKKLINDKNYFINLVNHLVDKCYGRNYIYYRLDEEKIDKSIIDEVMSSIDSTTYLDNIYKVSRKWLKNSKEIDVFKKYEKLKVYLSNHGFETPIIIKVSEELKHEERDNIK